MIAGDARVEGIDRLRRGAGGLRGGAGAGLRCVGGATADVEGYRQQPGLG